MTKLLYLIVLVFTVISCSHEVRNTEYMGQEILIENGDISMNNIENTSGSITYYNIPKNIEKLGFFIPDFQIVTKDVIGSYFENDSEYYVVGELELDNNKKAELILLESTPLYHRLGELLYFVKFENIYYFIPSISQTTFIDNQKDILPQLDTFSTKFLNQNIIFDTEEKFLEIFKKDFHIQKNISFTKDGKVYNLTFINKTNFIFNETNLEKIDFLSQQEDREFYIEKTENQLWGDEDFRKFEKMNYIEREKLGNKQKNKLRIEMSEVNFFQSDAIFLKMPDNTVSIYNLDIPFIEEGDFTYPSGEIEKQKIMKYTSISGITKNLGQYGYKENTSCGVKNGSYMYVPNGEYYFDGYDVAIANGIDFSQLKQGGLKDLPVKYNENELIESGQMSDGEKIYLFKNNDIELLQGMYNYSYMGNLDSYGCLDENRKFTRKEIECSSVKFLTYDEFISNMPVFFWKDPFGRNIMFLSWKVSEPSACGAKPVIYLYPEKKMDIQVTLDWEKKLLTSIPTYIDSWDVVSDEKSKIYDKESGKIYPYLFWEDIMNYITPTKGFVVKQTETSQFLDEKLSYVGLNKNEISDFKDYWLPQMQNNKYYFITFLQTERLNKIVPLTIIPKPDSIFRIFIDFEGLNEYKIVEKLQLKQFNREGFTVVEWGGKMK